MENGWDISAELGSRPPFDTIVCPIDRAEMVLVPKGQFTMGITKEELRHVFLRDGRVNQVFATELPARRVNLEAYYIDRYPVTKYQRYRLRGSNLRLTYLAYEYKSTEDLTLVLVHKRMMHWPYLRK